VFHGDANAKSIANNTARNLFEAKRGLTDPGAIGKSTHSTLQSFFPNEGLSSLHFSRK